VSYRLPEPGEVWQHQKLPHMITATVTGRDEDVVTFVARTVIHSHIRESERASAIELFVHNYQPVPEPFDPPPSEMFGVPL
jgi:hypothetical protein